jgi:hypothetical protein
MGSSRCPTFSECLKQLDTLSSRAILSLIELKPSLVGNLNSPQSEEDQVKRYRNMEKCLFGLEMNDVRRLAYQLAQKNNVRNSFSETNEKV